MSRTIEVEMKFEVLDAAAVTRFVKHLHLLEQKRIVDLYLDTVDGALFKRGIFIRIRDGEKFDIKFNEEDVGRNAGEALDHTHCDEVSNRLPLTKNSLVSINETLEFLGLVPMSEPALNDFMARNNLVESLTIDKQRSSYSDGQFHIDRDSVVNLGEYLEIEQMTDEHSDREEILERMRLRVASLGLKKVDVGYNELYWRKHNFQLYMQGKYLLAQDQAIRERGRGD